MAVAFSSNFCEQCHLKPKFGSYRFCGRTCGQLANLQTGLPSFPPDQCDFCYVRPKFWEGTRRHDYCSKSCADSAKANAHHPAPSGTNLTRPSQNTGLCDYLGCSNSTTSGAKYCSQHCLGLDDAPCLLCRTTPKKPKSAFCGSPNCEKFLSRTTPCIVEVPKSHPSFASVENQFQTSWKHSPYGPQVRKIFKIILERHSLQRYDAYKADVEARGMFSQDAQRKMTEGNERRRWHGTRKDCHLGDPGHHQGTSFCSSATCSLCKIIQDSFNLDQWGKNTGWGRFGKGIYTSATSSKANDYIRNNSASAYNAILLNNVIIGRGKKLIRSNTNLAAAPPSYDSILGEKGGALNHDEVVVYKGEAIRPSYLVVYDAT